MTKQNTNLTSAERREAEILNQEFNRLSAHVTALKHDGLRARLSQARADYADDPSDKNHEALLYAAVLVRHGEPADGLVVGLSHDAINTLIRDRIVPWADKIVVRLMLKARRFAATVIKEENERAEKLTGRALVSSPIIEAALQRVGKIEAVERLLFVESFVQVHPASPGALLRAIDSIPPLPEGADDEDTSAEFFAKQKKAIESAGGTFEHYVPVARRWPSLMVMPPAPRAEAVIPREPHPFEVQEPSADHKRGIQVSDLYPGKS